MATNIPVKKGGASGVCQVNPDSIPDELKAVNQWVVWNWGIRPDKDGTNKLTKIPIDPHTKQPAKTNDPDTWGSFAECVELHKRMAVGGGIGFVFTSGDGYCGIDIDKCRDKETGEMSERAKSILASFPTYAEVSPSGTGVKLLFKATMPGARNRKDGIEIYDRGRFFTLTGNLCEDHPLDVVDCQQALDTLHKQLFGNGVTTEFTPPKQVQITLNDSDLLRKIRGSKQGDKFERLWNGDATEYGTRSEADLALVNMLMFWTGGDEARVDSLFRQSGMYREKWDRADYRRSTYDTALANRDAFYDPLHGKQEKKKESETFDFPANIPEISIDDIATVDDLERAGAGTNWFWEKWIQNDVLNIIAAAGSAGKTRVLMDLIRRIKYGLPWPDGQPMNIDGESFRSLWMLADEHHNQVVDLAKRWKIKDKLWFTAYKSNPFDGTKLETDEDIVSLISICNAVKPRLVVIDTVGGSTVKNLAKQEDAMKYYKPLSSIARKYQCAFICICHVSANGQVYGIRSRERVRQQIQIIIPGQPNDMKRRFWVEKSTDATPEPLGMWMDEEGVHYDNDPPELPANYGNPFMQQGGKGFGNNNAASKPRPSQQPQCTAWLRELLGYGQTPVAAIEPDGRKRGFTQEEIVKALREVQAAVVDVNGVPFYSIN